MGNFLDILASITAGICLSMGTISFYLGWKQKDKSYLVFGLMAIFLFLFINMPPHGFIIKEQIPYTIEIKLKRIFIYSYYALFPWFIFWKTAQTKKLFPVIISLYVLACYWFMVFAIGSINMRALLTPPIIAFAAILAYGIHAGIRQFKTNEKRKAIWFMVALSSFGILFVITAGGLLDIKYISDLISPSLIMPIHLHAIFFIGLMGAQIVDEVISKYQLEKVLQVSNSRWQAFSIKRRNTILSNQVTTNAAINFL
jgi:hypothetical protein